MEIAWISFIRDSASCPGQGDFEAFQTLHAPSLLDLSLGVFECCCCLIHRWGAGRLQDLCPQQHLQAFEALLVEQVRTAQDEVWGPQQALTSLNANACARLAGSSHNLPSFKAQWPVLSHPSAALSAAL